jgi:phosphoribosylanthranilate isomerase
VLVKICGIRSIEDAILSSSFMPDYMGLIFCESPRKIDIEIGKKIVNNLSSEKFIGVFQDNQIEDVLKIAKTCNLFGIQLHGNEDPKDIEIIKKNNFVAIKAFRIEKSLPENLSEYKPDYFLFDKTKECKNLNVSALESYILNTPFFIAGGLNSENILDNIKKISSDRFCGIDLSSGVEKDNKKDLALLKSLFAILENQKKFN